MYKILIGLFLSVSCLQAKCQIQFDEGSFTKVLAKAKQEKKMVFMDLRFLQSKQKRVLSNICRLSCLQEEIF